MMEAVVTNGAIRHAMLQLNHQFVTTNKPTPKLLRAGRPSRRPTNNAKALTGETIL